MYDNALLDALPASEAQFLRSRLKPADFLRGDLFAEPGRPIDHVIFPRPGLLVSLVVDLSDGDRVEVGMVGSDGAIGGAAACDAGPATCTSFAQVPGRALLMRMADAAEFANESPEFRRLLCMQERYSQAQAEQTAACNAKHTIMHRLCSWLLRAHDAIGRGELLITQEHVSQMLGVQRASVSVFASRLQDEGLIQYRRGRLRIHDGAGLAKHACECHGVLRQKRELLMGLGASPSQQRALA
jgi:CRP-like cAMP-binding protein